MANKSDNQRLAKSLTIGKESMGSTTSLSDGQTGKMVPENGSSLKSPSAQCAMVAAVQPSSLQHQTWKQTEKNIGKTTIKQDEPSAQKSTATTDAGSQLRSTLAIGQLIASNRPTAGSRLIANELRELNKSIHEESILLRKEIECLSTNLASSLKSVLEEEREQRNMATALARRPLFTNGRGRGGFPVFRRPRRFSLQANQARKTTDGATNTSPLPGSSSSSNKQPINSPSGAKNAGPITSLKQIASKAHNNSPGPAMGSLKMLHKMLKNAWMPLDRSASSYDGEADTDSTDTTPSSSP